MNKTFDFVIAVIVLILTSCSGKIGPDHETGHAISFSVSQSFSAEVTKASLFEPEDLNVMDADHTMREISESWHTTQTQTDVTLTTLSGFISSTTLPTHNRQDGISGTAPASTPDTGL